MTEPEWLVHFRPDGSISKSLVFFLYFFFHPLLLLLYIYRSLYKWSYSEQKVVTTFYITCKTCRRVTAAPPEKVWELNLHHHGNWMWRSLSYHIITMIIITIIIITVNHVLSLSVALFANPVTVSIVILLSFFLRFLLPKMCPCVGVWHKHYVITFNFVIFRNYYQCLCVSVVHRCQLIFFSFISYVKQHFVV